MEESARLIASYMREDRAAVGDGEWPEKVMIIRSLATLHSRLAFAFLLSVVGDKGEYDLARIEALKALQLSEVNAWDRAIVASTLVSILLHDDDPDVRNYAAITLEVFVESPEVFVAMRKVVLDPEEDVDLRYNAFAGIERLGPTEAAVATLRGLLDDAELKATASRVLRGWGQ